MALFQQTVLKKHIESLDSKNIDQQWEKFRSIFHNLEKQNNIRNSKEEQFQEGFLRELFVGVLGYTINPDENFNLLTELKNVANSKKADGAILVDGKPIAVIELKGTETTDLNKIEVQAFGYKNNQHNCTYVITSNFEKLRFYIENTIQYEEFNLFTLTKERFQLLYACLSWESISKNTPIQILNESVSKENKITKDLYKDYSEFKRELYSSLVGLNPQYDKLLLFKKSQKLLDRFLFIFFAEDTSLLPTNLIFRINTEWQNLVASRVPVSLYDRYIMYFNDLNQGAKVTLPAFGKKTGEAITAEFEIFAYNGGLFQPDELLDTIKIDDTLLYNYTQKMSHYNFDSDVDVNILGHIFENSLNEIDEIKKEIATTVATMEHAPLTKKIEKTVVTREHAPLTKTISKRKKDGVFYTPKYITKYIVDNTIGKICTEKKIEIQLQDEDYITTHFDKISVSQKKTKKSLLDKLTDYRDWLLQLTICDPACGSGAFLNQALEFLIAEHRYIDELQAKLMGDSFILSDIENSILENNIFGVDLNDESVEIAKLSLWLRTAQKGRKLNSLSGNIKCGNSLIDDVEIAGDKAFSWEKEFPKVFKEKNKFAYHITTSLHDSRTSQRMIDYHARERRFEGAKPNAEVFPMTKEEEEIIAQTVSEIVKEDTLNIAAFNLCWDHMHILLVCEEEEIPKIMQKIKAKTARTINIFRGKTIATTPPTREHAPLTDIEYAASTEQTIATTREHAPLTDAGRGEKQNSFWTQKYGCKPITTDEQYWNTVNYIEHNKVKHDLPKNPKLESTIASFVKSYEDCLKTEYKGGFDVVIGNPPYVLCQQSNTDELTLKFYNNFNVASYKVDLFHLFFEKSINIIKLNGQLGFITPNTYLTNKYIKPLREFILNQTSIEKLVIHEEPVFDDANVDVATIILKKSIDDKIETEIVNCSKNGYFISNKKINQITWKADSEMIFNVKDSLKIKFKNCNELGDLYHTYFGIQAFNRNDSIENFKVDENYLPMIDGGDIFPFTRSIPNKFFNFIPTNIKSGGDKSVYERNRIVVRQIGQIPVVGYCNKNIVTSNTLYNIYPKTDDYSLYYLLAILDSKLIKCLWVSQYSDSKQLFPKVKGYQLKMLPIKTCSTKEQNKFNDIALIALQNKTEHLKSSNNFVSLLKSKYSIEKTTTKIQSWYNFEYKDFLKELSKLKVKFSLSEEAEWMEYFEEQKVKVLSIKSEIDKTDREIDQMVYALYELTEEEIKIVEGV